MISSILVYLKEILVYLVILKDIPLVIFMELNSQNLYSKWASQTAKKDDDSNHLSHAYYIVKKNLFKNITFQKKL